MTGCTYVCERIDYASALDSVTVRVINFTRQTSTGIDCIRQAPPTKGFSWVWKWSHAEAKSLGLDNNPGKTFSGKNITVVLENGPTGEKIPYQVCSAIEKMLTRSA